MVLIDGGASHWPNRQRAQAYWNLLSTENSQVKASVEAILARIGHGNYPALFKEFMPAMISAEREAPLVIKRLLAAGALVMSPAAQVRLPALMPEADKPLAKWVLHALDVQYVE